MNFNIIAVGKLKDEYFSSALAEYAKRISRFARINVTEVAEEYYNGSNAGEINVVTEKESARLAEKKRGFVIALDIDGKQMSSEGLADFVAKKAANGVSEFTFLVGGSHGMTEELKQKADLRLSFGKMTYPHQLMRVILAEQLYRALTITNGVPYHK